MRKILFCSLTACLLFSCSGSEEGGGESGEGTTDPNGEIVEEPFVSEVILIRDTLEEIDPSAANIMVKLEMCTQSDTVESLPPCDGRYFRVFDYMPNEILKEGFMVEMVPGLFGVPVHQLVIIRLSEEGKHEIVNQYMGMLLEMRTQEDGYNDLLISYHDPEVGKVAIRHEWNGTQYDPIDVEEINDHFVKPEMKDSINAIFIPAFSAGH